MAKIDTGVAGSSSGIVGTGSETQLGWSYRLVCSVSGGRGQLAPWVVARYADRCAQSEVLVWHNAGITVCYPSVATVGMYIKDYVAGVIEYNRLAYPGAPLGHVFVPWSVSVGIGGVVPVAPGAEYLTANAELVIAGVHAFAAGLQVPVYPGAVITATTQALVTSWTRL